MSAREYTIDLLRHGEPEGGRRYRGQRDDPLSERGWVEMWHTLGAAAPWQRLITSPLSRCHAFAHTLGLRCGLPVQVDARRLEIGFGAWEGYTRNEIEQQHPGAVTRFKQNPVSHAPLGAEPMQDFMARVAAAWHDLTLGIESTLVVCHAGVIRAILAVVLDLAPQALYRIGVPSGGLTRIRLAPDAPAMVEFHGRITPS